jgi:hypothetical protein
LLYFSPEELAMSLQHTEHGHIERDGVTFLRFWPREVLDSRDPKPPRTTFEIILELQSARSNADAHDGWAPVRARRDNPRGAA